MAAPKGNQFWQLRSKHGRDKLFESPELMYEAACEYFEWCDKNPHYKTEAKVVNIGDYRSEVQLIEMPVKRAYTLQALCMYLGCSSGYFRKFKANCSEDFFTVITHIEDIVYEQKFSGAASGFFNANIIARDLGLKDNTDITSDGKKIDQIFKIGGQEFKF